MNKYIPIQLPSSKSISNRALIIQFLCKGKCELLNLSQANDTLLLKYILSRSYTALAEIDVEDAGTPYRFLLALLAIQENRKYILKGSTTLHQRPIKDLVDALMSMGANIFYVDENGFPPVRIDGKKLEGGQVNIQGNVSSQFISALCLIAPSLQNGLHINIQGKMVSEKYIKMTLKIMEHFGVSAIYQNQSIQISPQSYQAQHLQIEADWSSACFFYAAVMVKPELCIQLKNISVNSIQGDGYMVELGKAFGIVTEEKQGDIFIHSTSINTYPKEIDLTDYPDLAIPFIVACAIRFPDVIINGISHLMFKESNRIEALKNELAMANIELIYQHDCIHFLNKMEATDELHFHAYNDHRMVMALNLFTLINIKVHFDNTTCVKKSFPDYWNQFSLLA
jgi:3-phosphoshikimate 1-carboxyvinyltransferase